VLNNSVLYRMHTIIIIVIITCYSMLYYKDKFYILQVE